MVPAGTSVRDCMKYAQIMLLAAGTSVRVYPAGRPDNVLRSAPTRATLDDLRASRATRIHGVARAFSKLVHLGEQSRFGFDDPEGFSKLVNDLWRKPRVVYAKPTVSKREFVLKYLGRYTHRVGIANSRLLDVTDEYVLFRTKRDSTETVSPVEFLRRFVQHVLPDGFHKIRHYGLNASPEKRDRGRAILKIPLGAVKPLSWRERLAKLNGHDVSRCPQCSGLLMSLPLAHARAPPEIAA